MAVRIEMSETKSCFNCVHVKTWSHGGFHEPIDEGFECGKDDVSDKGWVEPDNYHSMTDEEFALYCAKSCTDYEYNTPPTEEQLKAHAEEEKTWHSIADIYELNADLYLED